ncbi:unnamed protein product [Lactuca virosa]|uniref:Remorin C-terminal domain-containing protein n=1 Tax=Lactuca virosa TaxID=75947 RepID=A0AAU9N080_9ASTR|nr:unnamed protein product [Lactuca virosa]
MSDYQGFGSTNSTEDQNSNGEDIRDIHALTPTSVLPPLTLHPFESSLFMATSDGTSRDNYSNMSVTNSTLVVAGSAIGSIGFEYHGAIGEEYDVDDILHPSLSPRKLDEKKARAMEKMENEIAKAHQKAEERRAFAESIRGTKMARVLEVANWMKAVGRSPVKNFL